MRERIRIVVAACFYYGGLVRLAYWWKRRSGRRLVILNYHRASGGDLRRHLLYLRRHYRLLPLEAALAELYSSADAAMPGSDRRMPLVVTFDDGYHDNYAHAFALAQELQVPITIFLIPGYIESGEHFWWLESKRLVERAQVSEILIEERCYHLSRPEEREELSRVIDARLHHASSVSGREAFLSLMRQTLQVADEVTKEEEAVLPLTWGEVQKMQESGWVSFGAHTMHHPILADLTDPREVQREVGECRTVLEQQLGHPVQTFAYPVGKPEHFGMQGVQAVQAAGYQWAVTTIEEANDPQCDPYLLRRYPGVLEKHWLVMASELVGLLGIISRLKKKL